MNLNFNLNLKPGCLPTPGFFCPRWRQLLLVLCVLWSCGFVLQPVRAQAVRSPDDRTALDKDKLAACGLQVYESKRLVLVTDVAAEQVRNLPALADLLFDELERQLGPLRPDAIGREFQVTGFVIDAQERFEQAGVLPSEDYPFRHGRHFGYQFWMNNQATDYYRRHLLLHEFSHCFMTADHGMFDIPPLWYTEGIAEYFATHKLGETLSRTQFGVLPDSVDGFEGWGRIATIREAIASVSTDAAVQPVCLDVLRHPSDNRFVSDLQYAEAWALVWLIRNHPELKQPFASFSRVRNYDQFVEAERDLGDAVWQRLSIQWPLFLHSLTEGFDSTRSFVSLEKTPADWTGAVQSMELRADREWQSAGIRLSKGQTVSIGCTGRYVLHDQPRPWISEPQGITIDYCRGLPLGRVVGLLISDDGQQFTPLISVGTGATITASFRGELWLQINDSAALRQGNSGSASLVLEAAKTR